MSTADVWMPFYVADYLKDTGHLGHAEHGCYMLLLVQSWTMGPLPADEVSLSRLARCPLKDWRKIAPVVLAFFEMQGGKLISPRLERERARASAISNERRRAGANGAAKRWAAHGKREANGIANAIAEPLANASQTDAPSQSHSQKSTEPSVPAPVVAEPGDVRAALWSEGLSRLKRITGKPDGAARALMGKLCSSARDDCALVSTLLHQAEADRVGDPIPWLQATIQQRTGQRATRAIAEPSRRAWAFQAELDDARTVEAAQ